jgi:hypothetical protein
VLPVPVHGCLHLKTGATALPDGTALVHPGVLDHSRFADAGVPVLPVPEPAGANVLLSGDRVVAAASAPDTAALIEQRGYEIHVLDIGELEKLEPDSPACRVPPGLRLVPRSSRHHRRRMPELILPTTRLHAAFLECRDDWAPDCTRTGSAWEPTTTWTRPTASPPGCTGVSG